MGIRKARVRAERTAENRRLLLEAAREVFVRRGYQAATLDEVADAAGFTKGAVYSRFSSKADLFLALLEERIDRRVQEIVRLPVPSSREGGTDAMFRQWLERTRADQAWSLLVVEFRIAAAREPELLARYASVHEKLVCAVADSVRRAAEAGEFTTALPPEDLARLGLSFSTGILVERATTKRLSDSVAERGNTALFSALTTPRRAKPSERAARARSTRSRRKP